jgi:hypothetical protein
MPFGLALLSANPLAAGAAQAVTESRQLPPAARARLVATDDDDSMHEPHADDQAGMRYCDRDNSSGSEGGNDIDGKEDVVDAVYGVMEEASGDLAHLDEVVDDHAALVGLETPPVSDEGEDDPGLEFEDERLDAARVDAEPVHSPELVAESSRISANGYVSARLNPWAMLADTSGRVTDFPKTVPFEARSVTITCFIHPHCTPPPLRRSGTSDQALLKWLYSGAPPCADGSHRTKENARLHMAMFGAIARAAPKPADAGPASARPEPPLTVSLTGCENEGFKAPENTNKQQQ